MISLKKVYPSLIIFGTLCLLLIVFVVWPLLKDIDKTSQSFSSERNRVVYLNAEKENIQKIEKIYKTYEPDLDKIKILFFEQETPINFINFLEKTATDARVKMEISSMTKQEQQSTTKQGQKSTAKQQQKEDLWPSLSLQIVIFGSFNNTSKFLEKIENGLYLIETTDLDVTSLSSGQASGKEFEGVPGADTKTVLTIKAYTKWNLIRDKLSET